ncbi:MAG: nascent polypeptide-associated complex protein [Thermoprotei archaeon]
MRKLMRQMGLGSQELIEADQVIILSQSRKIVISHPQVLKMTIQGQTVYQVMGGSTQSENTAQGPELDPQDLKFVMSQAGCSEEEARRALIDSGGDVAGALLKLANRTK